VIISMPGVGRSGQRVFIQTARSGCRPFDGEIKNLSGVIPNVEIRGRGSYVLCPPSVIGLEEVTWYRRDGQYPARVAVRNVDWLVDDQGVPVQLDVRLLPQYLQAYSQSRE
jgi:hypothetical protein